MFDNNIYNRTDVNAEIISDKSYNLVIGLVLLWGFFVNYLMVTLIDTRILMEINYIVLFVGYFVCCMIGIAIFTKSDVPIVSFIGYNLVVIPFGVILNLVISGYSPDLVLDAIVITGLVTVVMMIAGTLFPKFFASIGGALSIALIAVIIVELVQIFIFKTHPAIMDWIVAVIFCGYIGYDWGRANRMPKTLDNAIDGAAAIYMDIINLFLRILRILARSRD